MTDKELYDLVVFLVVTPLQILFVVWLYRWMGRCLRAGRPSLNPAPIIDEGGGRYRIPVRAAFGGVRWLDWIGDSTNNFNPLLVVTPTGIECRVIFKRVASWAEIEQVDVRTLGATVNFCVLFRGRVRTFAGNLGSLILAKEALALLPADVALSESARALLGDPAVVARPSRVSGNDRSYRPS